MSKIPPFKRSSHTFVRGRQSQSVPELFFLLKSRHGRSTWALCPLQAGQRSSHRPLVCFPLASVLPASLPVAIVACHVSAGSRCSALSFNKSSYVLEGRWRVQTTINTGTLHQRVIWLSQAHSRLLSDTEQRPSAMAQMGKGGQDLKKGKWFIYTPKKKNLQKVQASREKNWCQNKVWMIKSPKIHESP